MKVTGLRIYAIKLALFSAVLAYLAVDLFLWHGPAWRAVHIRDVTETARKEQPAACVYGEPISPSQLKRYTAEYNTLRGRTETPQKERVPILMQMVEEALLRLHTRYNDLNLPDFTDKAEAEVERLASRAPSAETFDNWLKDQGYSGRTEYEHKIAAILKQEAWILRHLESVSQVSDADADLHYERLKHTLIMPAHRTLRHIFLPTQNRDTTEVQRKAERLLSRLENGEDFAVLARNYSQDEASAPHGGDLGTIYNDEQFLLPELPLFGERAIPADKASLAKSRWGWHILLPGKLVAERVLSAAECRKSLLSAIRSAQQEIGISRLQRQAVREAFAAGHLRLNTSDTPYPKKIGHGSEVPSRAPKTGDL